MAAPQPLPDILRALAVMLELGLTPIQIRALVEMRLTNSDISPRLQHALRMLVEAAILELEP
jgi:hypothetical protein